MDFFTALNKQLEYLPSCSRLKIYTSEWKSNLSISINFINSCIYSYLGCSSVELIVKKHQFGKPYIANYPDIHFNLSHSGSYIALAIGEKPVGIDIESIRLKPIIIDHFFSKQEKDYIYSNISDKDIRFTEVWTKKEAYCKWKGADLSLEIDNIKDLPVSCESYEIKTLVLDGYVLSICMSL